MSIDIKPVSTRKELKRFVQFPFSLYENNPWWVPPLFNGQLNTFSPEKNPAFEYCEAAYWLAYKDGEVAGRIAGIINKKFVDAWGEKLGRFGWLDFVDDAAVAQALLQTAEQWVCDRGMDGIIGPMGFTNFDTSGTLVEGFDELSTFGATYNHAYYAAHIEESGFRKVSDWLEYQMSIPKVIPEKVERIAKIVEKRFNLTLFFAKTVKELLPYAHEVFEIMNETYAHIYGFVPLSEKQIDKYIKDYFSFIRPEFVPVVLDKDGRVAAFGITMPSLSRAMQKARGRLLPFGLWHVLRAMRHPEIIDFQLTAVRTDYQNKGVNAMIMYEMNKVFLQREIKHVENDALWAVG